MKHIAQIKTIFPSPNTGHWWETVEVDENRLTVTDCDGTSVCISRDRARALLAEAIRLLDEIELFEKGPINER